MTLFPGRALEGNAGDAIDPLFVSPGAGEDYHLQKDSPVINVCPTGSSHDLDNRLRDRWDMGAFEYPNPMLQPWMLLLFNN